MLVFKKRKLAIKLLINVGKIDNRGTTNAVLSVGKGYNVLKDDFKTGAIFKTEESTLKETPFGIKIPAGVKLQEVNFSEAYMEYFQTCNEYTQERLRNLDINLSIFNFHNFSFKCRGGYNVANGSSESKDQSEESFLWEKRIFKLEIDDIKDPNLKFSDSFKHDVKNLLPMSYDRTMRDNYLEFFNNWGHYVVISAYGGGSVELKITGSSSDIRSSINKSAKVGLLTSFEYLSSGCDCEFSQKEMEYFSNVVKDYNCHVR